MSIFGLPIARVSVAGAAVAIAIFGARQAFKIFQSRRPPDLPEPGWRKQDPDELDKLLTTGIEDSMGASDPVSVTQPDVRRYP